MTDNLTVNWRLSPHLLWSEVRCRCNRCGGGMMRYEWIELFERFRWNISQHLGKETPLRMLSGLRCISHNEKIGGEPNSLHTRGEAGDIEKPPGITLVEFWQIALDSNPTGGTGFYNWWSNVGGVHLDIRPKKIHWHNVARGSHNIPGLPPELRGLNL